MHNNYDNSLNIQTDFKNIDIYQYIYIYILLTAVLIHLCYL